MYYIQDTTFGKYVTFKTVADLVGYFENMIPRAFKISKTQYIQNLIDLGYGYNDSDGVMLTRAMSEQFNIGQIKSGNYVKCDIHETIRFQQEEYGN